MQIIGHHAAARGETGLHVRLDFQPALDRFAGQQTGGDHHVGIARVGATGDRGDHHGAVTEELSCSRLGCTGRRDACTTKCDGPRDLLLGKPEAALLRRKPQRLLERAFHVAQCNAVLRAFRSRQAGLDTSPRSRCSILL